MIGFSIYVLGWDWIWVLVNNLPNFVNCLEPVVLGMAWRIRFRGYALLDIFSVFFILLLISVCLVIRK